MYEIEFYEKTNGECDVWDFLENLRIKVATNKDARIQYKQVTFYIELLKQNGSTLSENIMKHIEDDIWELRPGANRVFTFSMMKTENLYYFIISRRKHKRHPNVKSKEQKQKEMITRQGRRLKRNENMG